MVKEKEEANPEVKPDLQSSAEEAILDSSNAADPTPPATQQAAATTTAVTTTATTTAISTDGTTGNPQSSKEESTDDKDSASKNTDLGTEDLVIPRSEDALELYLVPQKYREARDERNNEEDAPGDMKNISFMAESLKVLESESGKKSDEYVDIEVSILSTRITLNKTQYVIDDLKSNAARLNAEGGLIFAMGKHDFDAADNVGVGKTFVDETQEMLKAKARIYNTSTYPDMVRRIRLGLVRDVSIEGMGKTYKRMCRKADCWIKVFGLKIKRATFVWAGADERAKITRVLESLAHEQGLEHNEYKTEKVNTMTEHKEQIPTGTDTPASTATAAKAAEAVETAGTKETNTTTDTEAGSEAKEAEVKNAPDQDVKAMFEKIMAVCNEMKKMMSDMKDMMKDSQEAAQQKETAQAKTADSEKTEVEVKEEIKEEKPPKVKESPATPGSASSNFYEQVKDLVR